MQSVQDKQPGARKREEHLSNDGKWRSFPKVPHLLQYVISGNYFGKVKINGKTIRESLQDNRLDNGAIAAERFSEGASGKQEQS